MSKNEALFGPHLGPYRPDARFGRGDGPACASPIHSAMDERPGSLAAGMTRRTCCHNHAESRCGGCQEAATGHAGGKCRPGPFVHRRMSG